LLALFTEKMTSGDGRVYYGRAVTYGQVKAWLKSLHGCAPCERTLRNWMRALERGGAVMVKKARMNQGMKIWVLSPVKHFREGQPRQMSLYSEPVEIPRGRPNPRQAELADKAVQNPVHKLRNSQVDARQKVAGCSGKKLPEKRSTSKEENLTYGAGAQAQPVHNRDRDLREFYRLRKVLDRMPSGHPRYRELLALWQQLGERIDSEIAQRREAG
jgi:hypothetical protein